MCAVIPAHLGKGTRWRVPVASPRPMTRIGIEPYDASIDRIAGQSLVGLGAFPLHQHRTMEDRNGRSSATQTGASKLPRDPHGQACCR